MLMVAEMTGSLALLPPAMIAIGLVAVVVREDSIYESPLRRRADAPAYRARFGLPLLGSAPVRDVMRRPRVVIPADSQLPSALQAVRTARARRVPVVDGARFLGVITSDMDGSRAPPSQAPRPTRRTRRCRPTPTAIRRSTRWCRRA